MPSIIDHLILATYILTMSILLYTYSHIKDTTISSKYSKEINISQVFNINYLSILNTPKIINFYYKDEYYKIEKLEKCVSEGRLPTWVLNCRSNLKQRLKIIVLNEQLITEKDLEESEDEEL